MRPTGGDHDEARLGARAWSLCFLHQAHALTDPSLVINAGNDTGPPGLLHPPVLLITVPGRILSRQKHTEGKQ
ncbi:MAG TPA: hypothetical protein VKV19_10345 [Ktedonobacteraceae bacterium]|jgi:hypothetical protein|nr:hypothetical protein [Ktedonobacteraceae bacterium]